MHAQSQTLSVGSSVTFDRLSEKDTSAHETDERKANSMSETDRINGFQKDDLEQLAKDLVSDPDGAKFKLRAKNRWIDGAQSISLVSSFYGMRREFIVRSAPFIQKSDTPTVLLGKDEGPSPMEELLVALAASVTTTLAYRAAMAGVKIAEIECDAEGDLDLQNVMDPSGKASRGFEQIRVTVQVRSDADQDRVAALCASSPVLATLMNPVPVTISVQTKSAAPAPTRFGGATPGTS